MAALLKKQRIEERAATDAPRRLRVDREAGIIYGVKVCGLRSKNGRLYPLGTLREAATKYEGAKVNVNHATRASEPRGYQDRIGSLKRIRVESDGLYGNLHFNPKHALAEQLIWDAENDPGAVGLSHSIDAMTRQRNGECVVEQITRVVSVDLVSDPATVSGLHESFQGVMANRLPGDEISDEVKARYRKMVMDTAVGEADPDEKDLAELLALMSATVEEFKDDVRAIKQVLQDRGMAPAKSENISATESIDLSKPSPVTSAGKLSRRY